MANVPQNVPMKKMKIGQYLVKVWTKVFSFLFLGHPVFQILKI